MSIKFVSNCFERCKIDRPLKKTLLFVTICVLYELIFQGGQAESKFEQLFSPESFHKGHINMTLSTLLKTQYIDRMFTHIRRAL